MAELRIEIPDNLKLEADSHPEIDWVSLVRKTITKYLQRLSLVEFLEIKLDKSEFTEEDAERLGELAKENRLRELKSKGIV